MVKKINNTYFTKEVGERAANNEQEAFEQDEAVLETLEQHESGVSDDAIVELIRLSQSPYISYLLLEEEATVENQGLSINESLQDLISMMYGLSLDQAFSVGLVNGVLSKLLIYKSE